MLKERRPHRSAQAQAAAPPPGAWAKPGSITDKVGSIIFSGTPLWWWAGFFLSGGLALIFLITLGSVAVQGVGLWGIQVPVVWGIAIINLVFWIGIGHAGTFISAFLLLMRQQWRTAFSRYAEAITLFALAVASVFPIFHLGRLNFFYWLAPYPNTLELLPQWRSALVFDFFAISTYGLSSTLLWYLDLVPDIAAMRDKAQNQFVKLFYGFLALGWRGDAFHWERLHKVLYLFAALATPLVISVHSIVAIDFAMAVAPGWHHTIFPPYFVAGAVFSGFAMVIIVASILRSGFKLQELITIGHMDKLAKLMLISGLLVTYGYAAEYFGAFFTGDAHELEVVNSRLVGAYSLPFWLMILFNCVLIQALWFKQVRTNPLALVGISLAVLVGMWLERFIIVSASLSFTYFPSMWQLFSLRIWDILTIFSPFGLFLTLLFLFIRLLPVLPISETQQIATEEG